MAHFQMKRRQRIESRALVPSLASDSPQFWFQSRRRTHLSRLSTAGHHGPRRQQTRQATQIDGEHSQREYVAHLGAAAQLDRRIVPPCCLLSPNNVSIILRTT